MRIRRNSSSGPSRPRRNRLRAIAIQGTIILAGAGAVYASLHRAPGAPTFTSVVSAKPALPYLTAAAAKPGIAEAAKATAFQAGLEHDRVQYWLSRLTGTASSSVGNTL